MERVLKLKKSLISGGSAMREKMNPYWQRMKQLSPLQKRVTIVMTLLLLCNIILMAKMFSGQDEVRFLTFDKSVLTFY